MPHKYWISYLNKPSYRYKRLTKKKIKDRKYNLGNLFKILFSFFGLFSVGCVFLFVWYSKNLPSPNTLIERKLTQSSKIYDRTGEHLLYEIHGEVKRTFVHLNEIPDYVKWATITIEDKNFYKHHGFDFRGIIRAFFINLIHGKILQGGSTITQQFVKNALLTRKKSFIRKIKEAILTFEIERKFTKDQILQFYLNEIPYGMNAYGIQAASQTYFNKDVKDLTLAEAALLAALPKAPTYYSPYGSNKGKLIRRQHYILDKMVDYGYISEETAELAKKQELKFSKVKDKIFAPHFVIYIKELLSQKYGEEFLQQEGLKIVTTLDYKAQKIAEQKIKEWMEKNKKFGASNAAFVLLDAKTGQILSMVGSKDFFDEKIDGQVNVALRPRQPGSSIKPIVYASAFIKGYTPNTILYDVETDFDPRENKEYIPHNYTEKEYGPVSFKKALAGSLNIASVKVLYLAGINQTINLAKEMGYTTLNDPKRYGLSLVLGGGEVKLLEHVGAFSVFAQEGIKHRISSILEIRNSKGEVLYKWEDEAYKVFDANISRMISDILSDNNARAYIFGERNYLTLPDRVFAAKTGTTNDFKDAWTIGYTPSYVGGVWVGNNDNTPMKKGATGSQVAAPILHNIMYEFLKDKPKEFFEPPKIPKTNKPILDGEIAPKKIIKIDKITRKLATEYTPKDLIEEIEVQEHHCILYYIDKDNPLGPLPKDPSLDPQFRNWEKAVQTWLEKNGIIPIEIPKEYDDVHLPENIPDLDIIYPKNNAVITTDLLKIKISAKPKKNFTLSKAEYYLDGKFLGSTGTPPYWWDLSLKGKSQGEHILKVKIFDNVFNSSSKQIIFYYKYKETNIEIKNQEDVSVKIISPVNGSILERDKFPFLIKLKIKNQSLVKKIELFYKDIQELPMFIDKISNPNSEEKIVWKKPPINGVYFIFGVYELKDGRRFKTDNVKIQVK